MTERSLHLLIRRKIAATPERLFAAWTTPLQLMSWWGPRGVRCTHAEVDLSVGGRYRIANALPDGQTLWIAGEFLVIERPEKLVYTWRLEPGNSESELVTVRFEARGNETEVIIIHERIVDERTRSEHGAGWEGCLEGLESYIARCALV